MNRSSHRRVLRYLMRRLGCQVVTADSCARLQPAVYCPRVRVRPWMLLLFALLFGGFRSSLFATRGDEHVAKGEWKQALASYDAALGSIPALDEEFRDEISAKRRAAIVKVTDQLLAEADAAATARQYDAAISLLTGVLKAGAFGIDASKQRVSAALTAIVDLRWAELESDASHHHYFKAVRAAEWLEQMIPEDEELRAKIADLRGRARAFHLALAEGAPRESRLFHLRVAQRFGALGLETELAALMSASAAIARPQYVLVPEGKIPGPECAAFLDSLKKKLSESAGGEPIIVRLALEKCAHREERWTKPEIFAHPSWAAREELISEKYYASGAELCPEAKCVRYDQLGVCVVRAVAAPCEPKAAELRDREVAVTRWTAVTATMSADVAHRRLASGVKGHLRLEWSGQTHDVPLDRILALEEQEVWTPAETRRFSKTQLGDLAGQVATETFSMLALGFSNFKDKLEQKHVLAAQKHAAAGRMREAEAEYIAASLARGYAIPVSEAHFGPPYGLVLGEMFLMLNGGLPRIAAAPIPYYGATVDYYADDRYFPLDNYALHRGSQIAEGEGFDIFARTETSPLAGSRWFESIGVKIRADNLHLSVEGRTPQLAGDSSGFGAAITGIFGAEGFYSTVGFAWDHERAENGERRYFLGVPISLIVPVGEVLSLEARADLNTFSLKTLFDDEPDDPHYYSPISLRAELDIGGRVYLSGAVRHYLGAGKDQLIDGGLELGLRL